MNWLRKHWKGAAFTLAGVVGTTIVGKIVDHYLDIGLFESLISFLATPLTVPLWLLTVIFISLLAWLTSVIRSLIGLPKLNRPQRFILALASNLTNRGKPHGSATIRMLMGGSGYSQLIVESSRDVLVEKGLIDWNWQFTDEAYATLTSKGRDYLMRTSDQPLLQ